MPFEVIERLLLVGMGNQFAHFLEEGGGSLSFCHSSFRARCNRGSGGGFFNFVDVVWSGVGNDAPGAVAPGDLDNELVGERAGGKDAHRIIGGKVASAADDLLALHGHGPAATFDLRAY